MLSLNLKYLLYIFYIFYISFIYISFIYIYIIYEILINTDIKFMNAITRFKKKKIKENKLWYLNFKMIIDIIKFKKNNVLDYLIT